jgi:hypothetical protein
LYLALDDSILRKTNIRRLVILQYVGQACSLTIIQKDNFGGLQIRPTN